MLQVYGGLPSLRLRRVKEVNQTNNNQWMKLKTYITESWDEITNKVTWPKYSELQSSAILVLVASIIFALVIGAIDWAFKYRSDRGTTKNFNTADMGELKWYVLAGRQRPGKEG